MNLFPFQDSAIQEIRDKYLHYLDAPNQTEGRDDPFIQFLRAITGAGKTPILAGAIGEMALAVAPEPIVLWTSKAAAVVSQTQINFDSGGKYHTFLQEFTAKDISEVRIADILDINNKLLITSTVASFNRTSKEGLHVFTPMPDRGGDISLWDALAHRNSKPLFIVYDEGHNTTDNQIDLLLELHPEVLLLASATPKITLRLSDFIRGNPRSEIVRRKITTTVETRDVVENELIKSVIRVTDYDNPEDFIIKDMVRQHREAEKLAHDGNLAIQPKCIYVSTTNDAGDKDRPFHQRKARPIVIWRTLVEKAGVDPDTIAVYCSLKGESFPANFHLIKKFEDLRNNNFRHIIFNLGLQEGWDDPEVYFAYIDKTLRSAREITQIIGRVLRQPHAKRTPYDALNSAHFFVNCPGERFKAVITDIRAEIGAHFNDPEHDYIHIIEQPRYLPEPLLPKRAVSVPKLSMKVDPEFVHELVNKLNQLSDYRDIPALAIKSGEQRTKIVAVKTGETTDLEKRTQGIGQIIQVGELFRRELLRHAKDAAEALDKDITGNEKFTAEICYTSKAAEEVRDLAWKVALMYIDFLTIEPGIEDFSVPSFQPVSSSYEKFTNALHDGYDHLNSDEESAARALDQIGISWFRNVPNADGYKVPLPLVGAHAKNFFPDFVAIGQKTIWFIDPKGNHLLSDAIRDKLISNIHLPDGRVMKVILIAKGTLEYVDGELLEKDKAKGITLIRKRGVGIKDIAQPYDDYFACFKDMLKE